MKLNTIFIRKLIISVFFGENNNLVIMSFIIIFNELKEKATLGITALNQLELLSKLNFATSMLNYEI